jgi:glutamate carboxypeptidase
MTNFLAFFKTRQDDMLLRLKQLVEIESPSHDKAAVDQVGARVAGWMQAAGATVTRLPRQDAGDLYLGSVVGVNKEKKLLILCHMDTVWPLGTVAERPPVYRDGRFYGPGAVDMKGGIVLALAVLEGLRDLGLKPAADVQLLMTGDEETGSVASRETIETLAQESALVLCLEPGLADGSLKTARKGGATFRITARGRAAHAGGAHGSGVNAIQEIAHHILYLQSLTDYERGTTVSVGEIQGGIATNIVPPECTIVVDTRVMYPGERERLSQLIHALKPVLPGATLEISESLGRAPMPRDARMALTFATAREIAARQGFDLTEASTGGASDGNLAAAFGIPVLDGLGPAGAGLHAVDEYVEVSSLAQRAALLAAILTEWPLMD